MKEETPTEKRENDEYSNKNVAFYATNLNAFIENRTELDKQLLTISIAAIGFLVAFSEKLIQGEKTALLLKFTCGLFFLTTIWILIIFHLNAKYLERVIVGDSIGTESTSKQLSKKDTIAKYCFCIANILALLLFTTADLTTKKGDLMSDSSKTRSLNDITVLKPQSPTSPTADKSTPPTSLETNDTISN